MFKFMQNYPNFIPILLIYKILSMPIIILERVYVYANDMVAAIISRRANNAKMILIIKGGGGGVIINQFLFLKHLFLNL